MLLLKERIYKIIGDIGSLRYSASMPIINYKMTEAIFKGAEEVNFDVSEWQDFDTSYQWGGYDKSFWFKTRFKTPKEFEGKPLVFEVITGTEAFWDKINPQFKIYVNGELKQGLDINHRESIITNCAIEGEEFEITLHAHSGMDDYLVNLKTNIFALEKDVETLYYNLKVPMDTITMLPEDNKQRIDMLNLINDAVNILDLRKPHSSEFHISVKEVNNYLEDNVLNGQMWSERSYVKAIGHTHIDIAWRWTIDQTRDKVVRSFATAIDLMEQYPEYIFMSSQPQLYKFVKEEQPDLYQKIKERVREGRWEVEGGMWVEADCNLISGESMSRQILVGTRFFEKEFNKENKVLWLPDVFGYSAAMPQVLKNTGIDYFITSKLSWNEYNKVPYDTFMWKGIDGTEVLTHFITSRDFEPIVNGFYTAYGGMLTPSQIAGGWQRYQQKSLNNEIIHPYGYGDGGGGPTKDMLENARRLSKGLPGAPKVKMSKTIDYFRDLDNKVSNNKRLPKWVGELYFEYHRGTYTSMAKNKKYNRKSEFLYQDIEWLASINTLFSNDFKYPKDKLDEGWELILLNQFHDILPGCSIPEVYVTSHKQYEQLTKQGCEMLLNAIENISANIKTDKKSVVIFNSLGFERTDIAKFYMPNGYKGIKVLDLQGNEMKTQIVNEDGREKVLFLAENIPSKGYKTFILEESLNSESIVNKDENKISNDYVTLVLNDDGTIASIYDKVSNREILKQGEKGNVLQCFEDKPIIFDAWDINMYYSEKMWEVDNVKSIELIEKGDIRATLKVVKTYQDSTIEQFIHVYNHTSRIDFVNNIDWNEKQTLLKVAFPIDVHADKATYEIQYGNVERATHQNTSWDAAKFEVCAHKWVDISEDDFGVSLLNDCKYGHDIKESNMRITLIKSGIYPNPNADQGIHQFTYSLYPHQGDWKKGNTVNEAYMLNCPLYCKVEEAHNGKLQPEYSMVTVDKENIIIDTIKKAEDNNSTVIRLFENYNRRTKVELKFANNINKIYESDILEKQNKEIEFNEKGIKFEIKPFEVKTFIVEFK